LEVAASIAAKMEIARFARLALVSIATIIAASWSASGVCCAQGKDPGSFESVPVLSASRVLSQKLLRGAHYSIDERVENDGYFNTYKVRTPFGIFRPSGRPLLEIRIREIQALGELDKLASSKVFLDAAKTTGKNVLLAPVRAAEKVVDTVSDPEKMMDTIKAVPQGAQRLFSWASRQVESAYDGASELISSRKDGDQGTKPKDNESTITASETLKQGRDLGLSFIGYNKRERAWFQKLQVSPYTSNQPLKDEITRVAAIETAVGVAFKFVPSLGLLSELNTFNTWYARAEKLALYEEPDAIRGKARAELVALGVPEDLVKRFFAHKSYTPWSQRLISSSLTTLGRSVKGHENFIRAALEANDEATALYFVSVAEQLEETHQQRKIDRIVASMYLPAGVLKDGTLFLPLQVDYLVWSADVSRLFSDFNKKVVIPERCKKAEVRVLGDLSARAKSELSRIGVVVSVDPP
jgi:hypothetical protein